MKLKSVRITEFQSIRDSNSFEVGDITCLVGKNEAGKTALLQSLYRLNPIIETDGNYDVTNDYPRTDVEDYRYDVESGAREPATVVRATFVLDNDDLQPIEAELGNEVLTKHEVILEKGYANKRIYTVKSNFERALKHMVASTQLLPEVSTELSKCSTAQEALDFIASQESTTEVNRLKGILFEIQKEGLSSYIYHKYLEPRLPKFLYFDEYYQMRGHENIDTLKQRVSQGNLQPSDHPMLGLIELARLNLDQLISPQRTQELVNKLEGAGNHLSKKVLKYWSQNKHLQMRFDVRPARSGDPEGMRTGTNIWASVYDSRHMVTTIIGSRSRGFIWFFSFLAWYSKLQRKNEPLILLLDEPGLSLHAKAQEDLLRFFEEELKDNHQLIYTTHSPFMVDSQHFERIRIVQDKSIDTLGPLPFEEDGTKVLTDVLEATEDSLFPLQGALGYEIYQTLFVGPNSLVVEGVSDLLYLQTISAFLQEEGRNGLSSKWTITPVGGSDKVPTFVALIGAQKGLKVATLIDIQKKDRQVIENLYKKKLLKKSHVFSFADFTGTDEADIEDMFESDFYLKLVEVEFRSDLQKPLTLAELNNNIPRMIVRLEEYFKKYPMNNDIQYNHYRPARYFSENLNLLKKDISKETLDRFEEVFKKLNALLK
jgi:predicted ATP-dependent endonuclease of OLD family